ncbi:hypothetical protein [Nocardia pneumoniae]|uniref:hypothetical protein n=1 Tax=Nocardia pneumoniae TaxID=228601 RepID=UPI0012F6D951|nr:hypothetical protein [Nocardia pneumoniae]
MTTGQMYFGAHQNAGNSETSLEADNPNKTLAVLNNRNFAQAPQPGSAATGLFGTAQQGVWGYSRRGVGVYGLSQDDGISPTGVIGRGLGLSNTGVMGEANSGGAAFGVWGLSSQGFAGYFSGKVHVSGLLSKSSGGFKIDHPLDPENRYLIHSFVESPDMLNVYSGNVETDDDGEAAVLLPSYFEALNQDFTYQLTTVGQFAQAIVVEEVYENRFKIKTDRPNVKVSWQVTGVRKDPYAARNRIAAEEDKPDEERGLYLHPEVYDQPRSRHINFERERAHEVNQASLKEQIAELLKGYGPPEQ